MVRIRDATASDAPAIARVHVEAWRNAYAGLLPDSVLVRMNRERHTLQWARTIGRRRPRDIVLVAETAAGAIVGFGSAGRARQPQLAFGGEIYTLYVHPEHQDQGVGRDLLNALFGALVARGVQSAFLWVLAENPSRFFYETMGGKRIAERDETLWNTTLHEIAYGWSNLKATRARSDAGGAG